ncbi:MAG: TIGR04283 family arsenosugar biosynthesis glycosyltransferase, partial [Rhodospirillaceae bacterium]
MSMHPSISVVVPALNAEKTLRPVLAAIAAEGPGEIIVVDGSSGDGTPDIARHRGARVITARRGRGSQLAAGAEAAKGDWLLFVHADTRLSPGWMKSVGAFAADPVNEMRAGVFEFRLDDPAPQARRIERLVSRRIRLLALPYGDQGLLISRAFYDSIGGFRTIPLMEDVDIVRRIGRRRLAVLDATAHTSAARY